MATGSFIVQNNGNISCSPEIEQSCWGEQSIKIEAPCPADKLDCRNNINHDLEKHFPYAYTLQLKCKYLPETKYLPREDRYIEII